MAFEGFRVLGTRERPSLGPTGQPVNEVVIDIATDLGATGQLVLRQNDYERMADQDLADLLQAKAQVLDRAMSL
jgi:hypothetical protein